MSIKIFSGVDPDRIKIKDIVYFERDGYNSPSRITNISLDKDNSMVITIEEGIYDKDNRFTAFTNPRVVKRFRWVVDKASVKQSLWSEIVEEVGRYDDTYIPT